jgi:epoxyqueuosine reductase
MTSAERSDFIRQQALKLGFDACGFAKAAPVRATDSAYFQQWLEQGHQGDMAYLQNHFDKRMDPTLLVDGCQSVVVVALNYYPPTPSRHVPKVARFAYGKDYHDFIREKLRNLLKTLRTEDPSVKGRAFCDSAPILERYWAQEAGLGWIGKNTLLIRPGAGSYFFLGMLLMNQPLVYDSPLPNRCGNCHRCREACPTGALTREGLRARNCLSYLTIEKKGAFSTEEIDLMKQGEWVFGCDQCQEACPWNRFSAAQPDPWFTPISVAFEWDRDNVAAMTDTVFAERFADTCLARTKREGMLRNVCAVGKKNAANP